MRDAVELGVACFMGMADADDDALITRLESLGVEPWLAERLVTWLPVAFGRRPFPQVAFPDDYHDGVERHRLGDDPVYVAAVERAQRARRAELDVIASRSADVRAINAYFTKMDAEGRKPDLASAKCATALTTPLPPIREGDGGVPEPRLAFRRMLAGHGVGDAARCNTVVVSRIDAQRFSLQVDFQLEEPRAKHGRIVESFAGRGATYRDALGDAVHKFERGSVHVLVAALLDERACGDQVTWERWPHPSGERRVCLGGQLMLYNPGAPVLGPLLDQLRDALVRVPLSPRIHTLRLFTARQGTQVFGGEVLLDGEPWPEGDALSAAFGWPQVDVPWGTRIFAILLP